MREKLSPSQLRAALAKCSGWRAQGKTCITKRFVFADFNAAFAWMTRVAMLAEKMDHHPEWSNVYKTVNVTLTTHDAGGVSALDIKMARFMNQTAGRAGRS